jgi:ATP-dependent exoDNAse (exonuclease V) alpha subunit
VVIVDEASTMPTRALATLADEVARRDGRLILVGDRDQLPSIDAGGAFASLGDRLGVAHLQENRRQRDELQRAVAGNLAEGRAPEAIALLQEHGRFQTYDDARQARADLIEAWSASSLQAPDRALILAHDRRDVAELNQFARARLDDAGRLGQARLFAHDREWAVGDRLLCRRNDYRPDVDVRNGTRATVTHVDRAAQNVAIHTDDGRNVKLPADYLEHVDYGYASTGHASQGATVDRTYLLATPERGGREWGYVAGSRHRIDLHVYAVHHDRADVQQALEKTWQRGHAKALAIDRMGAADRDQALDRTADHVRELDDKARAQRARDERERSRRANGRSL